ncbi:MAG: hypothetical protein CMH27_03920 [Micavibrio sp.]|nr:hypothetical protein [Micavibrio sp.]
MSLERTTKLGALAAAAAISFSPLSSDTADAYTFGSTSMTTMSTTNMLVMTAIIVSALDNSANSQLSVEEVLKGPISNMRECAMEHDIDIDGVIQAGIESGVTDSSSLRASDIGLSKRQARRLGDCTEEYRALDKLVGGFSAAYDQPSEAGYNTLVNYAGDHVDFDLDEYTYCMNEGGLQDAFSLPSGGSAVSRDDVLAFQDCADDYVSAAEQSTRNIMLYLALGVIGATGGFAFGYSRGRSLYL